MFQMLMFMSSSNTTLNCASVVMGIIFDPLGAESTDTAQSRSRSSSMLSHSGEHSSRHEAAKVWETR